MIEGQAEVGKQVADQIAHVFGVDAAPYSTALPKSPFGPYFSDGS
jgi:hypothetical protein